MNAKRAMLPLLAAAALFLMGVSGSMAPSTALQADFIKFEKAYIPALALTSQEKAAPSRKAMDTLNAAWADFSGTHLGAAGTLGSQPELSRVGEIIAEADALVTSGKFTAAHESLEQVRFIFLNWRTARGMESYVDGLTRFHEPMEGIVLGTKGKSALSSADLSALQEHYVKAEVAWARVQSASFDPALHGFNQGKVTAMEKVIQAESQALAAFGEALSSGDTARILKAGPAVKPNFAKTFMFFGEFPAAQ